MRLFAPLPSDSGSDIGDVSPTRGACGERAAGWLAGQCRTLPAMGMRATTVRFSEDLWNLLEREASHQGVSTAQLIREAAILRVASLATGRGDTELERSVEDLASRTRRHSRPTELVPEVRDSRRLAAVHATGLRDEENKPFLDRLADAARQVVNAPVGLITLIEADRQVFISAPGLQEPWASRGESPLAYSFCAETIDCRDPLVVNDARLDPRLKDNPAIREMDVVAYLGIPLVSRDGHVLGALCVIDSLPRTWVPGQVALVETLAQAALDHVASRPDAD